MSTYDSELQKERFIDGSVPIVAVSAFLTVATAFSAEGVWKAIRARGGGGASRHNGADSRDQQAPNPTPTNPPTTRRP